MNIFKNSKTGRAIICVSVLLLLVFASSVACVALTGTPEGESGETQVSELSPELPPAEAEQPSEPAAKDNGPSEDAVPDSPESAAKETSLPEPAEEPAPPTEETVLPEENVPAAENTLPEGEGGEAPEEAEESELIAEQEAQAGSCTVSFLGNCILGEQYISEKFFSDFPAFLLDDDLTLCCLGGCFTEPDAPQISTPYAVSSQYAQLIRASGVDAVNIANGYTASASEAEYAATVAALEANSIAYIEDWSDCIFITGNGTKIGLYASDGYVGSNIKQSIAAMRQAGAELIIACFTWDADNLDYYYENQNYGAHYAADCGADIVFGQGGDELEGIERYRDSIIIYNLGTLINSAFISESTHTAVIKLRFEKDDNSAFQLSETSFIPYLSGAAGNEPHKLDPGTQEYFDVLSSLVIKSFDEEEEP